MCYAPARKNTLPAIVIMAAVAFALGATYLAFSIRVLRRHERAVVVRLGRVMDGLKGPGVLVILPFLDQLIRVDLREPALRLPEGISRCEADKLLAGWRSARDRAV